MGDYYPPEEALPLGVVVTMLGQDVLADSGLAVTHLRPRGLLAEHPDGCCVVAYRGYAAAPSPLALRTLVLATDEVIRHGTARYPLHRPDPRFRLLQSGRLGIRRCQVPLHQVHQLTRPHAVLVGVRVANPLLRQRDQRPRGRKVGCRVSPLALGLRAA